MDYDELAGVVAAMPRLSSYSLHAHPLAIELLKQEIGPSREYTVLDDLQQLLFGIDIFAEADWEPGRYELRRDGEVIKEGTLP